MTNSLNEFGIQLILFLQSLGEWFTPPMRFFSFLGQEEFFLLIMPAVYWCIDVALGLRMGLILLLADSLNAVLKLAFHSPRPFWVNTMVRPLGYETSFGIPSGHAQDAAAVWGLLASRLQRPWIWAGLGLLIFLNGLSRVYLGVHFPQDVVAGWFIGLIVLGIFLRLEKPALAWLNRRSLGMRLLSAFAIVLVLILTGALIRSSLANWPLPEIWMENAVAISPEILETGPFSLKGLLTSTGALFGFAAGALWLFDRGGFEARGPMGKRLLRFPIGVAGVIILWFGLGAVFPSGDFLLAYLLRFLRYCLVGIWVSAGAPLLFMRLGLARMPVTLLSTPPVPSGERL